LGGVLLFFTATDFLAWASLAFLLGLAAVLSITQRKDGAGGIHALMLGLIVSIEFIGIQGFTSLRAGHMVTEYAHGRDPTSRVLDVSLSAFPSNPVCWSFVSVESNQQSGIYRLRRGIASIAPGVVPVSACPFSLAEAPRQKETAAGIAILFQEQGDLQALRLLSRTNCHFNAWLRFARMPSVSASAATDIRFSASPRGNFTTMKFEEFKNRECSRYIPQWAYPRADLLQ
jgi:inner membrane protein